MTCFFQKVQPSFELNLPKTQKYQLFRFNKLLSSMFGTIFQKYDNCSKSYKNIMKHCRFCCTQTSTLAHFWTLSRGIWEDELYSQIYFHSHWIWLCFRTTFPHSSNHGELSIDLFGFWWELPKFEVFIESRGQWDWELLKMEASVGIFWLRWTLLPHEDLHQEQNWESQMSMQVSDTIFSKLAERLAN